MLLPVNRNVKESAAGGSSAIAMPVGQVPEARFLPVGLSDRIPAWWLDGGRLMD